MTEETKIVAGVKRALICGAGHPHKKLEQIREALRGRVGHDVGITLLPDSHYPRDENPDEHTENTIVAVVEYADERPDTIIAFDRLH